MREVHCECAHMRRPLASPREINASAAEWAAAEPAAALELRERHEAARTACSRMATQTLSTGGWCLGRMVQDGLFGTERTIQMPMGTRSFTMPASHVEADLLIVYGLVKLLRLGRINSLSVSDFGGGLNAQTHSKAHPFCNSPLT
jgi:hypothetical protein